MTHPLYCCRKWRNIILSVLLSVFVLLGYAAHGAEKSTPFTSLVPMESAVIISFDAPWLWKSAFVIRTAPDVSMALQNAEKTLKLSIADDLLPWVGQTAFVWPEVKGKTTSFALFIQVRDNTRMISSPRIEAMVQTFLKQHTNNITWEDTSYKSVAIRRAEILEDEPVLQLAIARIDDWLVITAGDGLIKKIIDIHDGDSPSLASHPSFIRATESLPQNAVGQVYLNGQGILSLLPWQDGNTALRLRDTELGHGFFAGALRATESDLLMDGVYCSTLPRTQQVLKELSTDSSVFTGAPQTLLPPEAFITMLVNNPTKWINAFEALAVDYINIEKTRLYVIPDLYDWTNMMREVASYCPGELGISVACRNNGEFGTIVAAQATKTAVATTASMDFRRFLAKIGYQTKKKDNLYIIPSTEDYDKKYPLLYSWTTRQQWLLAASHPTWINRQSNNNKAFILPEVARDTNGVVMGNLAFVPLMLKSLSFHEDVRAKIASINYDAGQWSCAMTIDDDGGAVHFHAAADARILASATATTAAVLLPLCEVSYRKSLAIKSMSNLKRLMLAIQINAADNYDHIPIMRTSDDVKRVLKDIPAKILLSPGDNNPYLPNPSIAGKSLVFFMRNSSEIITLYEQTPWLNGWRFAAFLDGHVQPVRADEWEAVKKKSGIP